MRSKDCRRPSRSSRSRRATTRGPRSGRSPRCTTTCAAGGRGSAPRTVPRTARRSSVRTPRKSPTWSSPGPRERSWRCWRRWCAAVRASSATCSRPPRSRGSCGCVWTARPTTWRRCRNSTGAKSTLFSERYACPGSGLSLSELEPRQFSFNSPFGACPDCSGLGTRREVSPDLVLGEPSRSILEGVILPWGEPSGYVRKVILPSLARAFKFDLNTAWRDLPATVKKVVLSGAPGKTLTFQYDSERWHGEYESGWDGVLKHVERRYRETASDSVREQLEEYMIEQACPTCGGKRLRPESLSVLLHGKSIGDVVDLPVTDALQFFESIPLRGNGRTAGGLDPEIARPILKEVNDRLRFLSNVGLEYLTLGRSADSLSGGEAQRIRLATQIGSRLVGVLYILDEPSIGLHQRDNARLLATLKELRDIGNTVLVVEHDEETIRAADHLVDLGPRAGRHGGEVVVGRAHDTGPEHSHS